MSPIRTPPAEDSRSSLPVLFGMTSLFADMTYELAHVLLPALLLSLGGTATSAAWMESLAELAKTGGYWISGRAGTSPSRESLLVRAGYATTILATVLFSIAVNSWELVLLKSLSWFGKGVRGPARDALIANTLPDSLHARAFGTVRALDQTGGFLGPLAALTLSGTLSPASLIALSGIPGILCLVFAVAATSRAQQILHTAPLSTSASEDMSLTERLKIEIRRPEVRRYFMAGILLRSGLLPATLLMFRFASSHGTLSETASGFLLASAATVLASAAIARRIVSGAPRALFFASAILLFATYLLLASPRASLPLYLLAMLLWGAAEAAAGVALKVRGASLFPFALRSRGFALFEIACALASLLLWPLEARLWDAGQTLLGMGIAATTAAAGGVLLGREQEPGAR